MTRATSRRRLTIITSLEIKIVVYTHLNQINPQKGKRPVQGWVQNGRKEEQEIFVYRENDKLGKFLFCGFFFAQK